LGQYSNDLNGGNPNLIGGDIGPSQAAPRISMADLSRRSAPASKHADHFNFASEDFADNGNIIAKSIRFPVQTARPASCSATT